MAEHRTVAMTAPVGTDPLDTEAWKPITGITVSHPRIAAPPVRVLDPTPRRVSAVVMHHETLHGSFTLRWPVKLSPLTEAIIAAAVHRG